jgi:hypothetical protein
VWGLGFGFQDLAPCPPAGQAPPPGACPQRKVGVTLVQGLGFEVKNAGVMVWGLGFGVWGCGLWI